MKVEYKRLKECCTKIGSGATPKGGSSVYIDSGVSLIRSQNVYNLNFSYSGLAHINDDAAKKLNGVVVNKGDVLLNITGDSVARTCVVPDDVLPARVNQHVSIIRPLKDIDSRYLNYYLASPAMQGYLLNIASTGASRNAITKAMIEKLVIPFPDFESQRRIASILSAYDNLIVNNTRRIRLLEQMAENLYKEWFVRFRFPGHEKAEFENGLPKGWMIVCLSDYVDIVMGQSPESEYYNNIKEGLPFHQGVGSYGNFYLVDEVYATKGKKIAAPNSIIFSVRAPVGRVNITLNKIILGRGVASMNAKDKTNSFLFWMLKNLFSKEDIIGNGSIFTSVTKDELFKLKITLPSDDVRKDFDKMGVPIEKEIRSLTLENELLSRQRDLLLPRLMSGKLEVNI